MKKLKNYISKKLDIILEDEKSKKSPSVVASKLKSLGVSPKTIKKTVQRIKDMQINTPDVNNEEDIEVFPDRIHSDDELKNILLIRKNLKNKSPKFVYENLKNEKEAFINHYNNVFKSGASEFPGILELYSLFRTKRTKPNLGNGFIFKMLPEDAKAYGKDIVEYFLVKNSNVFPIKSRAKLSLDSYMDLLEISKVDKSYIENVRNFYYNKYKLNDMK